VTPFEKKKRKKGRRNIRDEAALSISMPHGFFDLNRKTIARRQEGEKKVCRWEFGSAVSWGGR